jgi:hypothetical protein
MNAIFLRLPYLRSQRIFEPEQTWCFDSMTPSRQWRKSMIARRKPMSNFLRQTGQPKDPLFSQSASTNGVFGEINADSAAFAFNSEIYHVFEWYS